MVVSVMKARSSTATIANGRSVWRPRFSRRVAWLAAILAGVTASFALAASVTYTYDTLDRVIRAVHSDGTVITYTYDAVGNMLTRSVGTGGASLPTVTTGAASAVATAGATLNGTVSSNGASTMVTFQFGSTMSYGNGAAATQSPLPVGAAGAAVSAAITGLMCGATYHFRAIGVNSVGRTNGANASFTTAACGVAMPMSVTRAGSGIGTVTSNPSGIACGADCSESYAPGTTVILTAAPLAGSAFSGWGGACTGTGGCAVSMSGTRNVTATFAYTGSAYSFDYVQKAFVAYYGRPADPAGQAYWAGRMDAEGQSLNAIIGAFGYSDEFNRRYGGLTNTQLVTRIYQQTLGRDPDTDGLNWYVNELVAGRRTLQTITLDVLNGATTPPDSTVVANKLGVAAYYSAKVAAGCVYGTEQDGVNIVSGVTAISATVTAAKAAIDSRCAP
jgi:YD repeat-containing protein